MTGIGVVTYSLISGFNIASGKEGLSLAGSFGGARSGGEMPAYIVRFTEFEYYNINQDEDWVRFMATTDKGSYYAERPKGSSRVFREDRDKFKAKVIECMAYQIDPCELDLEETIH